MLTKDEAALYSKLKNKSKNFENFDGYFEHADAPAVPSSSGSKTTLVSGGGQPAFSAQFDLQIFLKYFTLTGGVYTPVAPADLNAALQNKLPAFLFGHADFAAGFAKMQQTYPVSGWVYGIPGIVGKDLFTPYAFDANVNAVLDLGDMIIPFTSALPGAGTTTLAL